MKLLISSARYSIEFQLYEKEAALTVRNFLESLPFDAQARQARSAGEEIWVPEGPALNISPENASIHLEAGEIGIAPVQGRNKVAKSIAIVYGEAVLHDYVNIFGKVKSSDLGKLQQLGESIWLQGEEKLLFQSA